MTHQPTELLTPDEAAAAGAHAPLMASMVTLVKVFGVPTSVHASNVRAMRRPDGAQYFCCDGVVVREPLIFNTPMVIIESMAPLLGFCNNGFDGDRSPLLVAAYGKPILHKAWNVTVGTTLDPTVYCSSAFHYETAILHIVSEHTPKT